MDKESRYNIFIAAPQENGSAVFLILIAVVMFAALSYAVTQSTRGGGADLDKENKYLSSARIAEIGAGLQAAVQRMIFTGTSIDSVNLHAAGNKAAPCTSGVNCIFAPEGGGIPFPTLPEAQYIDKGVYGMNPATLYVFKIADGATVAGVNGGDPVILMTVRNINTTTCTNINKGLGLSGLPTVLWNDVNNGHITSSFSGARAGCVGTQGLAGDNTYYQVLAEH